MAGKNEVHLSIIADLEAGNIDSASKKFQQLFNSLNGGKGLGENFQKILKQLQGKISTFVSQAEGTFDSKLDLKKFQQSGKDISNLFKQLNSELKGIDSSELQQIFNIDTSKITQSTKQITQLKTKLNNIGIKEVDQLKTAFSQLEDVTNSPKLEQLRTSLSNMNFSDAESSIVSLMSNLKKFSGNTVETKAKIDNLKKAFSENGVESQEFANALNEVNNLFAKDTKADKYISNLLEIVNGYKQLKTTSNDVVNEIKEVNNALELEKISNIEQAENSFKQLTGTIGDFNNKIKDTEKKISEATNDMFSFNGQVEQLKQRAKYFLSLENSVDLFRQAVRKAFEAVKELDEAMTETAVVTDFDIGDMWNKLPEYTKMANELGVATLGVYEASTLYYQQGLETEQVMAMTNETLKMARIAGLEYEEATNLMTAALRGFNLEINEASAQRVNDVYSELAAITAADTEEIATAMTKTASIAASANMELETTAALLAQMIETTREPAETAGTAMKTIVARFTEMKEAVGGVATVEGEEVSVNKVDAALASVGISLKNAQGEFRDLDDVLLELASKWNTLDIMSQRYIATTAAGSRQQSRFIAMMSDYERTMELVDAAYDSSGSSAQQFEKTQESLTTKLNRLDNAWNEFVMGLADDSLIKGMVDALTGLVNLVNDLTQGFGDPLSGGIMKVASALLIMKGASKGVDKIAGHFIDLKQERTGQTDDNTTTKAKTGVLFANRVKGAALDSQLLKEAPTITAQEQATKKLTLAREELSLATQSVTLQQKKLDATITMGTTDEILKAENALIAAKTRSASVTQSLNIAEIESTSITEARNNAEQMLAATYSLSNAQATEALTLTQSGVGVELAALLAKKDVTKAEILQSLAKKGVTEATEEQIRAEAMEIAMQRKLVKSNLLVAATEKIQAATKKINSLRDTFNTLRSQGVGSFSAIGKAIGSTFSNSISQIGGFISSIGKLVAACWPVLAVLGAIVVAAVAAWAVWYNSDAQKAKRATETQTEVVESLNKEVQKTTESIQELTSAWDNISSAKDELKNLIQGTAAWNQKVSETNEEIDELVEKYPELEERGAISISANGVKSIDSGIYEEVLAEQEQKRKNLTLSRDLEESVLDNDYWEIITSDKTAIEQKDHYKEQMSKTDPKKESDLYEMYNEYYQKSLTAEEGHNEVTEKVKSDAQTAFQTYFSGSGYSEEAIKLGSEIAAGSYISQLQNREMGRSATKEEIDRYMKERGYESIGDDSMTYKKIGATTEDEDAIINVDRGDIETDDDYTKKIAGEEWKGIKVDNEWIAQQLDAADFSIQSKIVGEKAIAAIADSPEIVSALLSNPSTLSYDQLSQLEGDSGKYVQQLLANAIETTSGEDAEKVKEGLAAAYGVENFDDLINTIATRQSEAVNTRVSELNFNEGIDEEVKKTAAAATLSLESSLANVMSADKAKELANEYVQGIMNSVVNSSESEQVAQALEQSVNSASEALSVINNENPIETISALNQLMEEGNTAAKEFYQTLIEGSESYNSLAQVRQVLTAEDFVDAQQTLLSTFNEAGKITYEDIKEAATESGTLNQMLENGQVSATGFAKAMELVADGTYNVNTLTDELIKALTDANALMDTLSQSFERVSNFDPGNSYTEIATSYQDYAAAAKEIADSGMWGDPQLEEYMAFLVGENRWATALEEVGGSVKEAYERFAGEISSYESNVLSKWKALLKEHTPTWASQNGAGVELNYKELFKNGEGTEEIIQIIADDLKVTTEEAQDLLAMLSLASDEFSTLLKKADKGKAIASLVNGLITSETTTEVTISQEDAELFGITEKTLGEYDFKNSSGNLITVKIQSEGSNEDLETYFDTIFDKTRTITFTTENGTSQNFNSIDELITNVSNADTGKLLTAEILTDDNLDKALKSDSMKKLQEAFNLAVKDGTDAGLDLDSAKTEAINKISSKMGGTLNSSIQTALINGYQDPLTTAAAVDSANAQAQIYYKAIKTAIIKAFESVPLLNIGLDLTSIDSDVLDSEADSLFSTNNYQTTWMTSQGYAKDANGNYSADAITAYQKHLEERGTVVPPDLTTDTGSNEIEKLTRDEIKLKNIQEEINTLKEEQTAIDGVIGELDKQKIKDYERILELQEQDNSNKQQNLELAKREAEVQQRLLEAQLKENQEKGYDKYIKYDATTGSVYLDESFAGSTDGNVMNAYDATNEAADAVNNANLELEEAELALRNEISPQVEEELRSADIKEDITNTTEEQAKYEKIISELENDRIKNYPLMYAMLGKQVQLKAKEIKQTKELYKQEKAIWDQQVAQAKKAGLDEYLDINEETKNSKLNENYYALKKRYDEGDSTLTAQETAIIEQAISVNEDLNTQGETVSGIETDLFDSNMEMVSLIEQGINWGIEMIEQAVQYVTQAVQVVVDAWTNREDYLYNFLQVIEKHLREYERLQRYSTQLENGRLSTVQDIRDNVNAQWESLQTQLEEQRERRDSRQQYLNMSEWNPFSLISGWDSTSDALYENREIKMLWDLMIGFAGMLPMGLGQFASSLNQLYEDYDQRVQEAYEDRIAAEEAILDIEDERLELVKIGSEEATEFEQAVLDALIQKEQEQIDELSRLNGAVTDANSKLINTLQSNLEQIRQDRENEKKEEQLGEKQRRLSYLRQDTSGANLLEIKNLEEELEEEREDYTDTLIDQKITELQEQNDKAAEQRQQQIDLLQAQLDWSEKYGIYWDAVYGMLYTIDENGNAILNTDNFDLDGNIRANSELAKLLGTFTDQIGMSIWSQVLENEEMKKLGRYYGFFIGENGVTGEWANQWALEDPGADDLNYVTQQEQRPDGFWGILWDIENAVKKYFINSDMGLINKFNRIGVGLANVIGDIFGIDSLSNLEVTAANPTQLGESNTVKTMNFFDNVGDWFNELGNAITSTGSSTTKALENLTSSKYQNSGVTTNSYNLNIDSISTQVDEDTFFSKMVNFMRQEFGGNINILGQSR